MVFKDKFFKNQFVLCTVIFIAIHYLRKKISKLLWVKTWKIDEHRARINNVCTRVNNLRIAGDTFFFSMREKEIIPAMRNEWTCGFDGTKEQRAKITFRDKNDWLFDWFNLFKPLAPTAGAMSVTFVHKNGSNFFQKNFFRILQRKISRNPLFASQ